MYDPLFTIFDTPKSIIINVIKAVAFLDPANKRYDKDIQTSEKKVLHS